MCMNKSLIKLIFNIKKVFISHVIMIVNFENGPWKLSIFKIWKNYYFFKNSHSRFEISMKNHSEKKLTRYIFLKKDLHLNFLQFGNKTGGNFWIFNFFQYRFHILYLQRIYKKIEGLPGMLLQKTHFSLRIAKILYGCLHAF